MITQEQIDELKELQDELANVVNRISEICDQIGDEHARRYLIAGMEVAVESGSWMSHDMTLPGWIKELREQVGDNDL